MDNIKGYIEDLYSEEDQEMWHDKFTTEKGIEL
jgi:hypothetical protein